MLQNGLLPIKPTPAMQRKSDCLAAVNATPGSRKTASSLIAKSNVIFAHTGVHSWRRTYPQSSADQRIYRVRRSECDLRLNESAPDDRQRRT